MVIRGQRFSFDEVRQVLGSVLGQDLHAKRVDSRCDATLGDPVSVKQVVAWDL